jgi:hypothetical protein
MKLQVATAVVCAAMAAAVSAQAKKPAGAKPVTYDVTIKADTVYTGTMAMAVDRLGKVTGDMRLTSPTEITGKLAGTSKAGVVTLAFPYLMVERKCEGTVKMNITMPAKPGPAAGTMEAVGCGRDPANVLPGTVELKPAAPVKK